MSNEPQGLPAQKRKQKSKRVTVMITVGTKDLYTLSSEVAAQLTPIRVDEENAE